MADERRAQAEEALSRAVDRLIDDRYVRQRQNLFAAISEALYWIVVLDDWYEQSDRSYRTNRDADPVGASIPGLRYARNLATHARDLVELNDPAGGQTFPETFPMAFHGLLWKPLSSLPEPHRKNERGEESYRMHLERKDVQATIRGVLNYFGRLNPLGVINVV